MARLREQRRMLNISRSIMLRQPPEDGRRRRSDSTPFPGRLPKETPWCRAGLLSRRRDDLFGAPSLVVTTKTLAPFGGNPKKQVSLMADYLGSEI